MVLSFSSCGCTEVSVLSSDDVVVIVLVCGNAVVSIASCGDE